MVQFVVQADHFYIRVGGVEVEGVICIYLYTVGSIT